MVESNKELDTVVASHNDFDIEVRKVLNLFKKAGLIEIKVPSLLAAKDLVNLYGEDLKMRAYTTLDPVIGEQVLRPDFTLPILFEHARRNLSAARYFYRGNVWRRQSYDSIIPNEQYQMGFEFFDNKESDKIKTDVQAYFLMNKILQKYEVSSVTGDVQILISAIEELNISDYKKSSLKRHLWRPKRFSTLLNMYSAQKKGGLIFDAKKTIETKLLKKELTKINSIFGVRTKEDIEKRIEILEYELSKNLLSEGEKRFLLKLREFKGNLFQAPKKLKSMAQLGGKYKQALDKFEERVDLLNPITSSRIVKFEVIYGLTTLEYYDGFVFGFKLLKNGNHPPIAQGGRYDSLCTKLSNKSKVKGAIGSMLRMDFLKKTKI